MCISIFKYTEYQYVVQDCGISYALPMELSM